MTADFASGLAIGVLCGLVGHIMAVLAAELLKSLRK
jgi:hypothetical protein